jgi:hypothetical protein
MSTAVSHKGYEIISWPERAVSPDILYLQVGERVVAAATHIAGGWRIVLFATAGEETSVGANVGDDSDAYGWLNALGSLAAAAAVAA